MIRVSPSRRTPRSSAVLALVAALSTLAGGTLTTGPARAEGAAATGPAVTREVVGTSVQGRPIVLTHRAHEGATERVLVVGSIHGDELAGQRVVRRLLERANLPRELDLWMLKTVNPDGAAAYRRTNARGVDLNRNFPHRWRTSPRGATWSGPAAMSEPESDTLMKVVRRVDPWLIVVFHQPLFGVGETDKGMRTVRALAREMALPVKDYTCGSVCNGTFSGWVNNRTDSHAITVEFARSASDWRIWKATEAVVAVGSRRVR